MTKTCSVEGCDRKLVAKGLCGLHYQRVQRLGEPGPPGVRGSSAWHNRGQSICDIAHCDQPVAGLGFCQLHYNRFKRVGDPLRRVTDICRICNGPMPFDKRVSAVTCSAECNAKRAKSRQLNLRRYGITPEDYDERLASQGGRCAICRTTEPSGKANSYFHVDHDHETGVVRGLLCGRCNGALGLFGDDVANLLRAADYLSASCGALSVRLGGQNHGE
jgi:hypothetical protein